MSARIYLQSRAAEHKARPFALVDKKRLVQFAQHRWYVNKHGYAYRYDGGKCIHMHLAVHPAPAGFTVDHRNRNRLDNRRRNLRHIGLNEQQWNKSKYRTNTSGFKGVNKKGTGWEARIQAYGTRTCLGCFPSAAEAARAYDRAARRLHGKYAYQNL